MSNIIKISNDNDRTIIELFLLIIILYYIILCKDILKKELNKVKNIINVIFDNNKLILILYFILIKIVSINSSSSIIKLTIHGNGTQQILYQYYYYRNTPSKIIINEQNENYDVNYIVNNLENEINNITIIWNTPITDCEEMFKNLNNITSIDLINLTISNNINELDMRFMFYECSSLISLDLSNFIIANNVDNIYMDYMFYGCSLLISLDLSNFIIANNVNFLDMNYMFYGCSSLISLDLSNFINISNNAIPISEKQYMNCMFQKCCSLISLKLSNFFTPNITNMECMFEINKYSLYSYNFQYINKTKSECDSICNKESNYINYICLDDNICPENYKKKIKEKNICISNCSLDNIYKYEFNNICYNFTDIEYTDYNTYSTDYNTNTIYDVYDIINEISNNNTLILNDTQIDQIIDNIKNILLNINPDDIILNENEDIILLNNKNIEISLTSTEYNNKNKTTINLGKCENELKKVNNISYNESLIIYKMNILKDNMKIPRIEYEIYYPFNNKLKKLNLTICKDMNIIINIPIIINNNIDKYNISSKYYNDICYKDTSNKGTDITLNDRKNIFIDNDMNICEENCIFESYDINNKNAKCSCKIKTNLQLYSQIKKNTTLLLIGFKNIKNIINLNILKCYNTLFNINGISNNIGSYIILSVILFYFISIIIFYKKDYIIIKNNISNIINNISNLKSRQSIKINSNKNKIKLAPIKKTKKNNYSINLIQTTNIIQNNKLNENSNNILNINNTKNKKKINYSIYEINNLFYKDALKYDKRTYIQYYLSLIKTKHILLFCCLNDYNSRIIKILLLLFSFIIYFTINALFFNDSTIHKIYNDNGKYNILFQIPQIIYSSLISSILNIILKTLALSEQNIIKLKKIKNKKLINKKSKELIKFLYYKFISFFLISFIFLLFFWYYISLFCAVYENTQIHLIKDTLISFGLSMIYPFGIYLIPGIFRIPSLRSNNRKTMYKFSKIIQSI